MIVLQTNKGEIKIKLDEERTPATAQNFIEYVKSGYYDGVIFHRVIDGFMVQAGGFEEGMKAKSPNAPIENEADKGGENKRGTIAMARTMDPHSAAAQFFINVKDNDFLNFRSKDHQGCGYCVFGEVTEGMEVVDDIKKVKTSSQAWHDDVPVDAVVIERAFIEGTV